MKIKTGNQNKRRFYDGILQALTYLSSGISVLVLVCIVRLYLQQRLVFDQYGSADQ